MRLEALRQFAGRNKRFVIPILLVLAACYCLYWLQLGDLVPGVAPREIATHAASSSLPAIWHNPINAPYKLLVYAFSHISGHSIFWNRAASALMASVSAITFFSIIRRWHSKQIAVFATTLFATTGWTLHLGRLADPTIILLLAPVILIWLSNKFKYAGSHAGTLLISGAIIGGLLLYTPTVIWFIVLATVWSWPHILRQARQAKLWQAILAAIIPVIMLAALLFDLYIRHHSIPAYFGAPSHLPATLQILHNLAHSFLYLFVRGPQTPTFWLGHLPLLDVVASVMTLAGIIFYAWQGRRHVWRLKIIISFACVAVILMTLGNDLLISVLVPLAYMFAATGLAYILHEWYKVFPRNVLARKVGLGLLVLAVALAITYHVFGYFVAWQHNVDTVNTFRHML